MLFSAAGVLTGGMNRVGLGGVRLYEGHGNLWRVASVRIGFAAAPQPPVGTPPALLADLV